MEQPVRDLTEGEAFLDLVPSSPQDSAQNVLQRASMIVNDHNIIKFKILVGLRKKTLLQYRLRNCIKAGEVSKRESRQVAKRVKHLKSARRLSKNILLGFRSKRVPPL